MEDCPSHDEYLLRFKTIVAELGVIGKLLSEERKCFWMLQGLGDDYLMFATVMLRPPMLPLNELMDMLMSHGSRILKPMHTGSSSNQVAYMARKAYKKPHFLHEQDNDSHHRIGVSRMLLPKIKMHSWGLLNQNLLRKKCLLNLTVKDLQSQNFSVRSDFLLGIQQKGVGKDLTRTGKYLRLTKMYLPCKSQMWIRMSGSLIQVPLHPWAVTLLCLHID